MRKILLWATVAVIVAGGAVSCTTPYEVQPTPVEFTTIAKGAQSSATESDSIVITDEATWASLVANFLQAHPPPPELDWPDFGRCMLLAHFMGERPTSGYEVEFIEVLEGDEISVTVREVSPAPECTLAQVTTAPYDIIQIPKTDKQVKFTVEDIVRPCPAPTWYDWPLFHHDEQRTGKAEDSGIITDNAGFQWSYQVAGMAGIVGSPVVDEYGIIYFGSGDGRLYALNPDGTLKWSTPLTNPNVFITSSPGLSGSLSLYPGRIYIGTHESGVGDNFFAVDAETGNVIWPLQVPDLAPSAIMGGSSPLVVTDPVNGEPVIYVGAADGFLYCIRDHGFGPNDGEVVWGTQLQLLSATGFGSSAAIGSAEQLGRLGTIYCGGQENLYALDPYTGAIIDSIVLTTTANAYVSSPSVTMVDGVETIFAGTTDWQMRAVVFVAGQLWLAAGNYPANNTIIACPAIYDLNNDGKVEAIFGDGSGWVHSITYNQNLPMGLRWDTTSPVSWTHLTDSQGILSSAAVALAPQPTVIVGGCSLFGGKIYSLKWENGMESGSYVMPPSEIFVTSSPAVAQKITHPLGAPGWVFVGSVDNPTTPTTGQLYAFGPAP